MITKQDIIIDRLRAMGLNCNEIKTLKDDKISSEFRINNKNTKLTISDIQLNLLSTIYSKELFSEIDLDNANSITLIIKKVLLDEGYCDIVFKLVQDYKEYGNFLLVFKIINRIYYDDITGKEYYADY